MKGRMGGRLSESNVKSKGPLQQSLRGDFDKEFLEAASGRDVFEDPLGETAFLLSSKSAQSKDQRR